MKELEESSRLMADFNKIKNIQEQVVPVVVQDVESKEVLIVAYINELALQESVKQKRAVFWSTSRHELWVKGESSGDFLLLKEIRINCEQNSFLFLVTPIGNNAGACHTVAKNGKTRKSCYYRKLNTDSMSLQHITL